MRNDSESHSTSPRGRREAQPPVPARWDSLGLSPDLLERVETAGFTSPTEIQARTIPLAVQGHDLIASAKTGSGKTAAFSLPLIEKLKGRRGTLGLVLAPTREIALQTLETMRTFGEPLGVTSIALIGGTDLKADEKALALYPHVIVGTPGRICDHLERGNLWLEFIEYLVLDEADRMLDMGFAKELNRIVKELPANRQTLLFSATIPPSIEKLCREILHRPERVAVGSALSVNRNVSHEVLWVPEKFRRRELIRFLERHDGTAIVFTKTKDDCTHLWRSIHAAGIHESTYISSNKSQAHREEALEGFKTGRYRVLVATDVAGRGIHVENVGCVVNFGVPEEPEDYIHRVGRTGRKDQRGKAITFATPAEAKKIRRIEEVLKERIPARYARGLDAETLGHESFEGSRGGRSADRGRGRDRDEERFRRHSERARTDGRSARRGADRPRAAEARDDERGDRYRRESERSWDDWRSEPERSARRRERSRDDGPEPRERQWHGSDGRDDRIGRLRDRDWERLEHARHDHRKGRHHPEGRERHALPARDARAEGTAVHGHSRREPEPDWDGGRRRDADPSGGRPRYRNDFAEHETRYRGDGERPARRDARRPDDDHRRERLRHEPREQSERRPERSRRDGEAPSRREQQRPAERALRERGPRHPEPRHGGGRWGVEPRDSGRDDRSRDRSGTRDADREELLALEAEAWRVANEDRHPGVWSRDDEATERPFQHAAWELARARDARKAPSPRSGGRGGKSSLRSGGRSGDGRGRRR